MMCRCIDASDEFLPDLFSAIQDYFFAKPPLLRQVYIAAAAVTLAGRLGEPEDTKRTFGTGFSKDHMPRGRGDDAPAHVIAAVREFDCADSESDTESTSDSMRVVKWNDFLRRMQLVRAYFNYLTDSECNSHA